MSDQTEIDLSVTSREERTVRKESEKVYDDVTGMVAEEGDKTSDGCSDCASGCGGSGGCSAH